MAVKAGLRQPLSTLRGRLARREARVRGTALFGPDFRA